MIELLLIQPTPVSVAEALSSMQAAYASGAIADRMTYEVRRGDGTFDSVAVELRISNGASRTIRYDTNGFAFHAEPGRLVGGGVGPPEPRRVLVAEHAGKSAAQMITGTVPTGPLPQLWAFEDAVATDPALGVVRFTEASTELGATRLEGETAFGPVSMEIAAQSGRLISLRAVLRNGTVDLRVGAIDPGPPAEWEIETTARRRVSRIDQLAPNRTMLGATDALPDVAFQMPDGTGVSLAEWHAQPPPGAARSPWSVVLFADATASDASHVLRQAETMLRQIKREAVRRGDGATPAERFWLRFRPLIVLVLAQETALEPAGSRPRLEGVDVLYSTRPDQTIDRLPFAPMVAVGIDRNRVIGAIGKASEPTNNGAEAPFDATGFVDQLAAPSRNGRR
ncbi:MAG: hypothetical protein AAF937_00330 [Planctomycetota bacterium]